MQSMHAPASIRSPKDMSRGREIAQCWQRRNGAANRAVRGRHTGSAGQLLQTSQRLASNDPSVVGKRRVVRRVNICSIYSCTLLACPLFKRRPPLTRLLQTAGSVWPRWLRHGCMKRLPAACWTGFNGSNSSLGSGRIGVRCAVDCRPTLRWLPDILIQHVLWLKPRINV